MKCLNCGFECTDGEAFCHNCGSKLTLPEQPPQQVPQQPQQVFQQPQQVFQQSQQVFQQSQNTGFEVPKKSNNKLIAIILIIVGLLIVAAGAFVVFDDIIYAILDGFDIMDEHDLFSIIGSGDDKDDDDKDDDDKDKDGEDGSTKDADAKEEATTAASDAEKPKPAETTVVTETTTRYERETDAVTTTEAVATEAVSRPDSGAYDDYDWEVDVDRYLSLYWEMAEIAYEYMDVPDFEDLPQDVQDRVTAIEDEIEELEYRIDSFMNECDEDTYAEILGMITDGLTDLEDAYPEMFT